VGSKNLFELIMTASPSRITARLRITEPFPVLIRNVFDVECCCEHIPRKSRSSGLRKLPNVDDTLNLCGVQGCNKIGE